ncbi:hypothetical protein [Streptomyces sp.]|uniref:hypothetical protein n=1 Tax=Streptomyces sp. TaxID=1931 RepID=UPI002F9395BA
MADIAIDSGSPALASNGDVSSVSTASFTRPAGGLLVAMVFAISNATYTLAGGSLTWTRQVSGGADIWTAPVTGSGSMTVTVGNLVSGGFVGRGAAIKVIGLTGQSLLDSIGATGEGESTTNNLTAIGYTSTVAGSRGFFAGREAAISGAPTSTDTGFAWSFSTTEAFPATYRGLFSYKASNTASPSSDVTFNADASGSGTADWEWVALEIVPDVNVRSRTVTSRAAVHRAASW